MTEKALHPNYGLSKSKDETVSDELFIDPLPRAVLRPNSFILLDGEWRFSIDRHDKGIQDRWHLNHRFEYTAQWPGSVEEHMRQGMKTDHTWHDKYVAWYQRDFPSPIKEETGGPQTQLQLTFGACGYETQVWLNGHLLKTIEDEYIHYGEYTSFSYELDDSLLQPVNRLTVRIAGTMDAEIPRGKQESHVYKRGGIWYQTYTGAVRSIWLETVERNRLRSRVGVISVIEDNLVRFNFTTRIHDPGAYILRLKIYNKSINEKTGAEMNELLAVDEYPLLLEAGQKMQRLVMELPNARLWSPEEPQLYRLVAQLIDQNNYGAEIETTFGLRKIEARGANIYLNNEPIYLDGILYQPGDASFQEIRRHMYAMKKLGCNLVRIHIAGVDPRIYKLADKLGLLLWLEVPSPHHSSKKSRQNHREELLRMLALVETHPSVIIWSLYNEDWGAEDIAVNEETRTYIMDMFHFMQIAHPQFLVVDNDGWRHISYRGRLKSSMLTAHLYTAEVERWKELLDKLAAGHLDDVAAFPLVVGDPFFYRKQVPLVVSEWGGFGFADYGGPDDANAKEEKIRDFKKELRKRAIAGDVYTQATNIEDERNGIIDFETGELQVSEGLLKTFEKGKAK